MFLYYIKITQSLEKNVKLIFCINKWDPNQCFCSREKLQVLEIIFFRKKILPAFAQIWFSKRCAEIFFKEMGLEILTFRKVVLHNNIINKIRSTKNQENSAHRFGDNYLFAVAKSLWACNFIKKKLQHRCFFCEIYRIFKNTYFEVHLRTTVSIFSLKFSSSLSLSLSLPLQKCIFIV